MVIVNVNIIPMDFEHVLEKQTVLIDKNKIVQIGPTNEVNIPSESCIVDGLGKYLIPGLSDMHIHLNTEEDLTLAIINGVTTVRNVFGFPHIVDWKKEIESGKRIGPRILTSGPIIDGDQPFLPYSSVVTTREQIQKEIKSQKEAGYDFIKVFNGLTRENYKQILIDSEKIGIPVIGHIPFDISVTEAINLGQYSIEHLEGYWHEVIRDKYNSRPWEKVTGHQRYIEMYTTLLDEIATMTKNNLINVSDLLDHDKLELLANKTFQAGTWNVPTLVVTHHSCITLEARKKIVKDRIQYVHPDYLSFWDQGESDLSEFKSGMDIWHEHRKAIVYALFKAGAGILVGTDSPNPYVIPGFSVHEELQFFVEAGLSPYEALKTATYNSAKFLNDLDKYGTIEVGKHADMVLLDQNPLVDIKNSTKISAVIASGNLYTREKINLMLEEISTKFSKK